MRSKALLVISTAFAALVTGCSSGSSHLAAAGQHDIALPSPTASPTPSPTPTGDPLTGLALASGPVVAIKIDNAFLARPYQRGLDQAAVIYQELVEGGSTRFMAIFESASATREVGPIRSARESDIDILRAYHGPGLAFSGAQPGVFALVRAAARLGRVVDASYDATPGSYRPAEHRADARNFFAVPARLGLKRGGAQPTDVGLRFGDLTGGAPTLAANASFSPNSLVRIRYNRATGTYVLSQGNHVIPVHPDNVIVQVVATHPSRFHDVHGMNSPLTVSTGGGRTIVMRDGVRFQGRWSRRAYGATHYRDATGQDILLKPGLTWVLLLPKGRTFSIG